jgi:hypothetical protein
MGVSRAVVAFTFVLAPLAVPGCSNLLQRTVQQNVTNAAETARLCRGIQPAPFADGGTDDTRLVDLSHDVRLRVATELGDMRTLFEAPEKQILPEAGPSATGEWKADVDGVRASFETAHHSAFALASCVFGNGGFVAPSLQSGTYEQRYDLALQSLQKAASATTCTGLGTKLFADIEAAQASAQKFEMLRATILARDTNQSGAESKEVVLAATGRVRAYLHILRGARTIAAAIRDRDVARFLSTVASREIGGVSRVAFRMIRSSLRSLDRQLQTVDGKLSGAISSYMLVSGAELQPVLRATGCEMGCTIGEILRRMDVSPEGVLAEACAAATGEEAGRDDLVILGGALPALYAGMIKGFVLQCEQEDAGRAPPKNVATLTSADAGTGSSTTASVQAKGPETTMSKDVFADAPSPAAFARTGAGISLLAEYEARLRYETAHAAEPPADDPLFERRREAFVRALLTEPVTIGASDPGALAASIATLAHELEQKRETAGGGGGGTGSDLTPLFARLGDLQAAIARKEQLSAVGQDLAALCGLIGLDGALHVPGPPAKPTTFDATCSETASAERPYNVATIGLNMSFPEGRWNLVGALAPPGTGTVASPLKPNAERLAHLSEDITVSVDGVEPMTMTIYGFSSEKPYACSKLREELMENAIPTCARDPALPVAADAGAPNPDVCVFGPANAFSVAVERASRACKTDVDGNAILSALRAYSTAQLMRGSLPKKWEIRIAENAFRVGGGNAGMQRVVLQMRPKRTP